VRGWIAATASCLLCLVACGGGSSRSPANTSPPSGGQQAGGGTTNPQGQLITPTPVSVSSGVTTTTVDIAVPALAPPLNAQDLGANNVSASQASAFNTGGAVARGGSALILMFGTGLTGSLNIRISGPQDISISNVQGVTSTDNTPGIAFMVTVPSSAAVGVRTVILSDAQGNATTFTGGLEVI
jgi:hypothetical protein